MGRLELSDNAVEVLRWLHAPEGEEPFGVDDTDDVYSALRELVAAGLLSLTVRGEDRARGGS